MNSLILKGHGTQKKKNKKEDVLEIESVLSTCKVYLNFKWILWSENYKFYQNLLLVESNLATSDTQMILG